MYLDFIKNYVNKLKKEDISLYAFKNNIILDNNELNLIYNTIKERWDEIYSNGIEVIREYKDKLKDSTYNKIVKLYEDIKRYYKL